MRKLSSRSSAMVIGRITDPEPKDDRIPIGPGDVITASMHRCGAVLTDASFSVPDQSRVHAKDVGIRRILKRRIRQAHRVIKQFFMFHAAIIGVGRGFGHSYFPLVMCMRRLLRTRQAVRIGHLSEI